MKNMYTLRLLSLLFCLELCRAQLHLQIREYELADGSYTVLSNHLISTTYANIPPEGISGLIYYPQPPDGCSSLMEPSDCFEIVNLLRIALLDEYHLCTQQKLLSIQEADFDAMFTYSPKESPREVGSDVYDESTGMTVDVKGSGIPVIVFSENFSSVILDIAIKTCTPENLTSLVGVNVSITSGAPVLLIALYFTLCLILVCFTSFLIFLNLATCFRTRRTGRYNVQNTQLQELGGEGRAAFHGTLFAPCAPEQKKFQMGSESITQCAVCLEDFVDSEVVSVLKCEGNHMFHPSCIDRWLDSKGTCPVCRTFVTTLQ